MRISDWSSDVCSSDLTIYVDLARRVVDMVVAAHHVGDLHVEVVDDHGEVVGRIAVGTEDRQVVELAVGDLDPALDLVVPGDDAAERVLAADHPVGMVEMRSVPPRRDTRRGGEGGVR